MERQRFNLTELGTKANQVRDMENPRKVLIWPNCILITGLQNLEEKCTKKIGRLQLKLQKMKFQPFVIHLRMR